MARFTAHRVGCWLCPYSVMGDISHTRCSERKSKFYQRPTEVAFSSLPRDFIDLRRCAKSVSCVVCTIQRRRYIGQHWVTYVWRHEQLTYPWTAHERVLFWSTWRCGSICVSISMSVCLSVCLSVCPEIILEASSTFCNSPPNLIRGRPLHWQVEAGSRMLPGKSWEEVKNSKLGGKFFSGGEL